MVIPEVSVGSCLILRVLEAHSTKERADAVIGEPSFFGVYIKQTVHLIFLSVPGVIYTQEKQLPLYIHSTYSFHHRSCRVFAMCGEGREWKFGGGVLNSEQPAACKPARWATPSYGGHFRLAGWRHANPLFPPSQGDKHKSPCPVET